jgi:DNA segregation ATPase FtsK/SpoIIIE, S-DNA-T family
MERCEGCGFEYGELGSAEVGSRIRQLAAAHVEELESARLTSGSDRVLRSRPAPSVWSALEYACHVRDVLLAQRDRLILTLLEDMPSFSKMYRDERAKLLVYGEEPVDEVVAELIVAANLFAKTFEKLSPANLARVCVYNYPVPAERTVAWVGDHTVHEVSHHLGDVISVLGLMNASSS